MLREITAEQFFDWKAYSEIRPFGPAAEDARFALLAEVIVNALGARTPTGSYTSAHFLRALGRDVALPEVKKQSIEEMTKNLNDMFAGVNAHFAELGGTSER